MLVLSGGNLSKPQPPVTANLFLGDRSSWAFPEETSPGLDAAWAGPLCAPPSLPCVTVTVTPIWPGCSALPQTSNPRRQVNGGSSGSPQPRRLSNLPTAAPLFQAASCACPELGCGPSQVLLSRRAVGTVGARPRFQKAKLQWIPIFQNRKNKTNQSRCSNM